MSIPDFQSIMLPLLVLLADGAEHSNQEIYEGLENQFGMTEEEKSRLLSGGKQTVFINRIAWAKTHLKQAGLIESSRRGVYKISALGENIVRKEKPSRIDVRYLMRFPSFVQFRQGKANSKENEAVTERYGTEITPEEHIEFGMNSIAQKVKQELLLNIKSCSFYFFEKLVIDIILAMGYGGSRHDAGKLTKRGSDEGIDGIINEDKLGLDVIYLQAKRWENTIGRPEIQKFAGALQGKRAKKGIYITTATFTKEAYEFASSIDSKIILIDGDRLAELMIEHDVGVTTMQVFRLKKVDSDYFVEE